MPSGNPETCVIGRGGTEPADDLTALDTPAIVS